MSSKATDCVHAGSLPDPRGGKASPIYPSTAYNYVDVDTYYYPRYFNTPNQIAVEEKLAALEGTEAAMVFSSGMAATMSIFMAFLRSGDHVLLQNDIYGGTQDSVRSELTKLGIEVSFCVGTLGSLQKCIQKNTRLIFIESPSNPLLSIVDIRAIADLARTHGIISVIDSTFASPINQTPAEFGIDIIMHSATKYLGGHSDITAGAAAMSSDCRERIREAALHFGGTLDLQACWLLERSMKTLGVRVKQQNQNAQILAEFLEAHRQVEKVYYPGLLSSPHHELATSQMTGYGGMLSFELKGDCNDFVTKLKVISPAMSLGGVESTVTSPSQTSHARISASERKELGIKDNLLRLSVGIEDVNDLVSDMAQALG